MLNKVSEGRTEEERVADLVKFHFMVYSLGGYEHNELTRWLPSVFFYGDTFSSQQYAGLSLIHI